MEEVTDPGLLDALNSGQPAQGKEVTDPATLAQLNAPDEGALMAVGRGAARNFPMAQQAIAALEPGKYDENLKSLVSGAESAKVAHPVAYGAGAVAGTAAPLLIPGVGEGLEAAPILGNAALGASQALSDANLTKPTGQDLKNATIGAGVGGLMGGVGKAIQAVAPSAQEMAASSTAAGLGATARNVGKVMGQEPEQALPALGQWLNKTVTPEGDPIVALANRPGKMLNAVQSVHDSAGEKIGGIIDEINSAFKANANEAGHLESPVTLNAGTLKTALAPIAEELNIINPQSEAKVLNIIKKLDSLDESGKLDFEALQKLKSTVGKSMGDDPNMAQAYGKFAEYMDGIVDQYGAKIQNPEIKAAYEAAKHDYRNASQVIPIMRRAEGRALAQGPMGNSGLLGLFGLGAGVAAGHPVGGAAAAIGSAVGRPIANMVGRNVALKAVPIMPAVAATGRGLNKTAMMELANFLQSKLGKGQ